MRTAQITILLEIEGFQNEITATARYVFTPAMQANHTDPAVLASAELISLKFGALDLITLLNNKQTIAIQDTLADQCEEDALELAA